MWAPLNFGKERRRVNPRFVLDTDEKISGRFNDVFLWCHEQIMVARGCEEIHNILKEEYCLLYRRHYLRNMRDCFLWNFVKVILFWTLADAQVRLQVCELTLLHISFSAWIHRQNIWEMLVMSHFKVPN